MVCCYECGKHFKSRVKEDEIQVYDNKLRAWVVNCPNCGRLGFDEEDYLGDDDEDDSYYDAEEEDNGVYYYDD